jgi:putative membrane protein insertion efficiency factor
MSPAARVAVLAVRGYQRLVSPFLPAGCRFAPSCSEYAAQAITDHGIVRGIGLAARRLARCHPFHPGGYDPPPLPRRRE